VKTRGTSPQRRRTNLKSVVVPGHCPFSIDLPNEWHALPPVGDLLDAGWVHRWLAPRHFADAERTSLTLELPSVARFIRSQFALDQVWFAMLEPSGRGGVRALISLVAYDSHGLTAPVAHKRLDDSAASEVDVDILTRQSVQDTLAGFPAVIVHDLIMLADDAGPALSERYVGMVFPEFAPITVQLEIQAPDLGAFDDVVAAANDVLDGLRFLQAAPTH